MSCLVLDRVSKRYGAVQAVDGVSLTVAAGERVAFVGSNGSGKTTLMRCALGLLSCEGGVNIEGIDVRRHPERALAEVAYIPQVAPPLDATVSDLVTAFGRLRARPASRVAELAAVLGLDYGRISKSRLRDLSGGTKQKILAALALAADARILVADEPTASLDTQARHAFFSLVAARPADSVLVLCSHRTGEVRQLVNRVVELREGRVVSDAQLDDIVRDRAVCRIEVVTSTAGAAASLRALGFAAVTDDLWQRTCTPAEKLDLVSRLLEHRADIDDVRVLDVDAWQVSA
ncbi:MAG: ATP-binding cassette domain-containing protein [Candidatus Binatia bacterium]